MTQNDAEVFKVHSPKRPATRVKNLFQIPRDRNPDIFIKWDRNPDIFTKGTEIRTFSDKGTFYYCESCKWSEAPAAKLEGT